MRSFRRNLSILCGWMCFAVSNLQFRAAIQLRFDFHRAVYNLGTVLVSRSRISSTALHYCSVPAVWFWKWQDQLRWHSTKENTGRTGQTVVCRLLIFVMLQYGLAEDTSRSGQKRNPKELAPADLYSLSAVYIAAAHALKPDYPVCSLPCFSCSQKHCGPRALSLHTGGHSSR
jgi:hypothetical protein